MIGKKWQLWVLSQVLLSLNAVATATDVGDLFELSIDELSQVTVTIANRVGEPVIDASSSVTVVSRSEIERLGVRTLTELLNYVLGFQSLMTPQESGSSLILARGLSDNFGRNILLMIDGHRINEEYTGGFTYIDRLISLYNVKKVEFIRGPGSALYGSNAFSGVINIITDKSKKLAVLLGNNQSKGVTLSTYGKIGQVSGDIAFNYYQDSGQTYSGLIDKNGFNKSTIDPVLVTESRVNLSYKKSRLIFEYLTNELEGYYVFNRIDDKVNLNNSKRIGVYFEQDFKAIGGWKGKGRIGYMRHERHEFTLLDPADVSVFRNDLQQDTRELQVDLNSVTASNHQLSFGVYAGLMDIPHAYDSFESRNVLDENRITLAAYFQDQFHFLEKFSVTAGLRFDDYRGFGNSLSPRLTLNYRMQKNDAFKLMYGSAYRAPSLGDIYDKEGVVSTGNLGLKPVTVKTYEFAYIHSSKKTNVTLTSFFNDYQDVIGTRRTATGDNVFENVYDNKNLGLELDFNLSFNDHWSSRAGLTRILLRRIQSPPDITFSKPDTLAPKTYGNVSLNYRRNKFNGNLSVVARDKISVLQSQSALMLTNGKVTYKPKRHWTLGLSAKNMFDIKYAVPRHNSLGVDEFGRSIQEFPARGREFYLTLSYMNEK